MDYKKLNNYIGWAVFLIATLVYVLTLEGTTSLWDCGEYITTAYKLEVGHPPGAPLFMMLGRLFTVFASPDSAAYMVNLMSALSSSFTILFLFWSITMIAKRIILSPNDNLFSKADTTDKERRISLSTGEKWAVLGSGIIGALAYTFTDSFWFSAVEGEVYAMSSFFTALVVWAILKWESELTAQEYFPEDEEVQSKNANRWIVFIFFMVGLSIGVHLLNLLCIPVLAYVIYFKKYKETTWLGFILTGVIGVAVLGVIQAVIIPVTINLAGTMERVFRNSLGLPFNSGAIFFFILITGIIVALLMYSRKNNKPILNIITWSGSMLLIGYTCFAMIVIRSNANPPLDENDPENLVSLESYLKREQYGDWPILYGQYFNAKTLSRNQWGDRSDVYLRRFVVTDKSGLKDIAGFETEAEANEFAAGNKGKVVEKYYKSFDGKNQKPKYNPKESTVFPRMYSAEDRHVRGYLSWSGATSKTRTPEFSENLSYFVNYQVNWMYWRYFMWNFSGRQSDEQGHGNARDGNWISGLNFIDKHHVGDQTLVPSIIKDNPSHNKFYMLPLILGLIGFIFTMLKASRSWWLITILFLLTGVAVIIYLNQKPFEPRERDYAYAASFYAFSFWIGLSVLGLFKAYKSMEWKELSKIAMGLGVFTLILFVGGVATGISMLYISAMIVLAFALMIGLKSSIKSEAQMAILATLICLPVPILMGMQGWDDHDRSGRYTAKALANNYMIGCSTNSILFTNGDNDTFPLWYLQEVEGQQTDLRVCNLSLFSTDWYTAQMKRKAYDSEPLPISFEEEEYRQNKYLDVVYVQSSNQLTMQSESLSQKGKDIMNLKMQHNPALFAKGFKNACGQLYAILAQSKLAATQPEVVASVQTFNQTGTYYKFRDFVFKLIKSGKQLGLNDQQLQGIQKVLQDFNDSFDYLPLSYVMDFLHDEKNLYDNQGNKLFLLPSRGFTMPIDAEHIKANKIVEEKDFDRIAKELRWKLPSGKNYITKAEIMVINIISNFNWDRDLYFAGAASPSTYLGLQKYFFNEGLVYKLVPLEIKKNRNPNSFGEVNKAVAYDNLMNKYIWGNMEKEGVLVDYYTKRGVSNYRIQFSVLADAYAEDYDMANRKLDFFKNIDGDSASVEMEKLEAIKAEAKEKIISLFNRALEVMPSHKVPFGRLIPYYVSGYLSVEAFEEGEALAAEAMSAYEEELDYYLDVDAEFSKSMLEDASNVLRSMLTIYQSVNVVYTSTNEALKTRIENSVQKYMMAFESKKNEYRKADALNAYNGTVGGLINQFTRQQP